MDKEDGVVNLVLWTSKSMIFQTHLCVLDLVSTDDGQFINCFVTFVHLRRIFGDIKKSCSIWY